MAESSAQGTGHSGANTVVGAVLIALGALFLIAQFLDINMGQALWPFFIIVPGLAFFVAMLLGGKSLGALAIPGSVITTVGLILLYQNTFHHWESWSYAWALIPTAVGVGLMIQGQWTAQPSTREKGERLARIGAILFVAFGAFFELLLNIGGFWGIGKWAWPLLLVAIGLYLLLRRGKASGRA